MTKFIYNYHPETGEYVGQAEADESPLDPGTYLIPANATEMKPPAQLEGFVRVFDGEKWINVPVQAPAEPSPEQVAAAVTRARAAAYMQESDPIFFKWQRDEATKEEWLAKVAEIKARIPDGVMPA